MTIQVWKHTMFGPKQVRDKLLAYLEQGHVYATWLVDPPLLSKRSRMNVRLALAHQLLGAVEIECPETGTKPDYRSYFGKEEGYQYSHSTSGEDSITILKCATCGYFTIDHGGDGIHPPTTMILTTKRTGFFDSARWDHNALAEAEEDTETVIWVFGLHFMSTKRSLKKAKRRFPDATVVHTSNKFAILQMTHVRQPT